MSGRQTQTTALKGRAQPFSQRPFNAGTELGRFLLVMEAIDCDCRRAKPYRPGDLGAFRDGTPRDPGVPAYWLLMAIMGVTRKGLVPPCEHILDAIHGWSVDADGEPLITIDLWAHMLLAWDRPVYSDRPAPPHPKEHLAVSKVALAQLYLERLAAGYGLYHPADLSDQQMDDIGLAVMARPGKKHGKGGLETDKDIEEEEEIRLEDEFRRWFREKQRRARCNRQTRRASEVLR